MELFIANNHYLICTEYHLLLIDTGCPFSFAFEEDIEDDLEGEPITIKKGTIARDDKQLMFNLVGEEFDGIIGNDIIARLGLTINYAERICSFNRNKNKEARELDILYTNQGILLKNKVLINNQLLSNVILDTGAYISYVKKDYLSHPTSKMYHDYSPLFGFIDDCFYEEKIKLSDSDTRNAFEHEVAIGALISPLDHFFDGVINPCLIASKEITFDLRNNKIYIL